MIYLFFTAFNLSFSPADYFHFSIISHRTTKISHIFSHFSSHFSCGSYFFTYIVFRFFSRPFLSISVERQKQLEATKQETKEYFERFFRVRSRDQSKDLEITKKDFLSLLEDKKVCVFPHCLSREKH